MYCKEKQARISKEFSRLEGKKGKKLAKRGLYKFSRCQLLYLKFNVRSAASYLTDRRAVVSHIP
jgi:hypothetical protein